MNLCKFCGESIQDTARKCPHCQSYQDAADAPKQSFDLATIVISFVGLIATIATIAAGVFGYLGVRTIGDINDRTEKVIEKSTSVLQTADQKIQQSGIELQKLQKTVSELQEQALNVRKDLNGVAISRQHERFQQLFDQIQLDYAYNFPAQIADLTDIARASASLQPIPQMEAAYVTEMQALSLAIVEYRNALKDNDRDGYLTVMNLLANVAEDNLGKARLMIGCYSHLSDIALRAGNQNDSLNYLSKQKHYALIALRAAERLNRSATVAKVNYAVTLIQGGEKEEMEKAYSLLIEARKDAPQLSIISYNIAVYFTKKSKFDEALTNLEQAKTQGDFSTCEDLNQWMRDKDFDSLRLSDVPAYKARIEKLKEIPGGRC